VCSLFNALVSAVLVAALRDLHAGGCRSAGDRRVLVVAGFFRSLEFTSLNTIAYADVGQPPYEPRHLGWSRSPNRCRSRPGVAIGALVVDSDSVGCAPFHHHGRRFPAGLHHHRGHRRLRLFVFVRMPADAGRGTARRSDAPTAGPTEAADQKL
jgi:hypothetical protein